MPGTIEVGPRWAALVNHIGFVALLLDDTDTAERVYQELSGLAPASWRTAPASCSAAAQRSEWAATSPWPPAGLTRRSGAIPLL